MNNASRLLELQREVEREFARRELEARRDPQGWSPALLLFHVTQWRERMVNGLTDLKAGRASTPPQVNIDELNDAELPRGAGRSLEEMAQRANDLMGRLIELSEAVGDQPFTWSITKTTGEAIIRNSYLHPRVHLAAYHRENGEQTLAWKLTEDTVSDLRANSGPPVVLGAALYNLAGVRAAQQRQDEAIELLESGLEMRPDLKAAAEHDPDLAPLKGDSRFEALTSG